VRALFAIRAFSLVRKIGRIQKFPIFDGTVTVEHVPFLFINAYI